MSGYLPKRCPSCRSPRVAADGPIWRCAKCKQTGSVGDRPKGGPKTEHGRVLSQRPTSAALTPEAVAMLAVLGAHLQISRSRVIERAVRELFLAQCGRESVTPAMLEALGRRA